MNAFDVIVAVIAGYCLIRGIFRGLVKEVSSIVGVLAGFFAAYTYYDAAAGLLARFISTAAYRQIFGFLIIFCAVLVAVNLLALVIRYLLKIVFLGWLDRAGGVVFGLVKGVLIVSVVFMALTAFLPKGTPLIQNSASAPYISRVSELMAQAVSPDMKREFLAKLDDMRKAWKSLN
jgi:membrane protein required for colicin V production